MTTTPADEFALRRGALAERLADLGVAAAAIGDPRDLLYLTGYEGVTTLGPNPFVGLLSATLLVADTGQSVLVVGAPDSLLFGLQAGAIEVVAFETFGDPTSLRPRDRMGRALDRTLTACGIATNATVGYQGSAITAVVFDTVAELRPRGRLIDVDREVAALRMRKSASELDALRRAIAVCDVAQAAVAEHAAPGVSQADLVDVAQKAVDGAAGAPTPTLIEASYGSSYGKAGAERPMRVGDLLVTDIAPRVGAYWGDSCDTLAIGDPTDEQRLMLATIREALEQGTDAVRPGVTAHAVDAIMRAHLATRFPVYEGSGGHGVGLDFHEPPRLRPGEMTPLDADMVITLEPGIYLEHACARLEHLVRVVPQGCEVISRHLCP
jgi:Xaa-Pro dipeptidase